jgi:hypothetical protein
VTEDAGRPVTFIIRVRLEEGGSISGMVEQVRTGRKEPVRAIEDVGRIIATIVAAERRARPM